MKWFLIGSLFIFFSCQDGNSLPVLSEPLLTGNQSIILLESDQTGIPLENLVNRPERIDSVTSDGPFAIEIDNSNIILYGKPRTNIYSLTLWSEGFSESLILKKAQKSLYSFLYQGDAKKVRVIGNFEGEESSEIELKRNGRVFNGYVLLSPGEYEYYFEVDGKRITDPYNRDSIKTVNGWISKLTFQEKKSVDEPMVELLSHSKDELVFDFPDDIEKYFILWENSILTSSFLRKEEGRLYINIPSNANNEEVSKIMIWTENSERVYYEEIKLEFGEVLEEIAIAQFARSVLSNVV